MVSGFCSVWDILKHQFSFLSVQGGSSLQHRGTQQRMHCMHTQNYDICMQPLFKIGSTAVSIALQWRRGSIGSNIKFCQEFVQVNAKSAQKMSDV